ncbi:hypothetical protein A9Q96_03185 [Rhodobacterales bacterium 52_120_T64]|nr:hypothetical protein A9Q96_03185 [Rhodobacterales bacterium 52_120_T64]
MYLGISAVLFGAYFINVFLGTIGGGLRLSGVSEMLILMVAVLFFVAGILKREAEARKSEE